MVEVTYSGTGAGESSLLLMPGWCSSSAVFSPVSAALARRHRVVAIDWPGHGASPEPDADFGFEEMASAAAGVADSIGAGEIVPVAVSHAGWIAIDLFRRMPDRIRRIVLIDWLVLDPPPPFLGALAALQDEEAWRGVRDVLFSKWSGDPADERVRQFLQRDMAGFGFDMWARGGREIAKAYASSGSPLAALSAMPDRPLVRHLYAQPDDPGYLSAQQSFAEQHPWFSVVKLNARTHFPMFEIPSAVAAEIENAASMTK